MRQHTALAELPDVLDDLGLNHVELDASFDLAGGVYDFRTAQGDYLYTNPDNDADRSYDYGPSCVVIHGSGSSHGTWTPVIRDSAGKWSVGPIVVGLWDGNPQYRVTQDGPGDPLIVVTSLGPGRYSAGACHWPTVRDYLFTDRGCDAPYQQSRRDEGHALNRYSLNIEMACRNQVALDLDEGVIDHAVGAATAAHLILGHTDRTAAHKTTTTRKPVDPEANGRRDLIVPMREAVRDAVAAGGNMRPETYQADQESDRWERRFAWPILQAITRGSATHPEGYRPDLDHNSTWNLDQLVDGTRNRDRLGIPDGASIRLVTQTELNALYALIGAAPKDRIYSEGMEAEAWDDWKRRHLA